MLSRIRGVVKAITADRPGVQEITVETEREERPAVNYPPITGVIREGDTVWLNTWAVSLGLGTGGVDYVVAIDHGEEQAHPPGHVMKLRYTPSQLPVLAAEAPESPHHEALINFKSFNGTPVVCCELHSQVAAVAIAARKTGRASLKIVYVMTDGAALPAAVSRLAAQLRSGGFVDAIVTAGQAFGGDYEAVNIYSALAVAKAVAGADVIIVGQGPGNAGTGTELGFSGIDQGIALNAAAALGGEAIAVPRISFADKRERHRGLSHHARTVLERVVMAPVTVPLPKLAGDERTEVEGAVKNLRERHRFVEIDAGGAVAALSALALELKTMDRRPEQDPVFFQAAWAAGVFAADRVSEM